jgi:hypothetical protein
MVHIEMMHSGGGIVEGFSMLGMLGTYVLLFAYFL